MYTLKKDGEDIVEYNIFGDIIDFIISNEIIGLDYEIHCGPVIRYSVGFYNLHGLFGESKFFSYGPTVVNEKYSEFRVLINLESFKSFDKDNYNWKKEGF